MNILLRITGLGKLVSFYRYIYFNGAGVVRWSGIGLVLVIGLTHMYEFPEHFEAAEYIGLSFVALFASSLLSALWILKGLRWGWLLGAVISGVAFVSYIISRTLGLPGFSEAVGAWDTPSGTVSEIFDVMYLGLWFSIITGMNVAAPDKRNWHD